MAAQPDSPGVINRLVRSLSSNKVVNASKSHSPSISPGSEIPQPESHGSTAAWRKKISAIDRFKNFGKNRKENKVEFPPPAWFDDKENNGTTVAAAVALPDTPGPVVEPASSGDANPHDPVIKPPTPTPPDHATCTVESGEERSEPSYIARKIQTLMDSLPPFSSSSASGSRVVVTQPPQIDEEGRPIPPPPPAPINDSRFVSLLSSASVMNGSIGRGTQSVWSVLEKLRAPKRPAQGGEVEQGAEEGGAGGDVSKDGQNENDYDDDNSSVMMCSPLIPGADSKVLLADSEMVPVIEEDETGRHHTEQPQQGPSQSEEKPLPKRPNQGIWPWRVKEHRVWVPSATNISVQATWWGFRIYLPPPVLDILNSKQLEAAKRAAMITTALKWLLDHLPVKLVPLQFRPVIPMLKQLTPYLGYIGVFIAWSWGAIKTYDKGHGVVLTATWILPVALIPSTWDANDFPPITIYTEKSPAGEDKEKPNGSGKQEDVSTEGKSDATTTRPSSSRKGKERAW